MDHYEVRQWPSWYRHITLCMMALVWLTLARAGLDRARLAAFRGAAPPAPARLALPREPTSVAPAPATPHALAAPVEVRPTALEATASAAMVGGPEAAPSDDNPGPVPEADAGKKGGPARLRRAGSSARAVRWRDGPSRKCAGSWSSCCRCRATAASSGSPGFSGGCASASRPGAATIVGVVTSHRPGEPLHNLHEPKSGCSIKRAALGGNGQWGITDRRSAMPWRCSAPGVARAGVGAVAPIVLSA